jgi:hypothetical protein
LWADVVIFPLKPTAAILKPLALNLPETTGSLGFAACLAAAALPEDAMTPPKVSAMLTAAIVARRVEPSIWTPPLRPRDKSNCSQVIWQ